MARPLSSIVTEEGVVDAALEALSIFFESQDCEIDRKEERLIRKLWLFGLQKAEEILIDGFYTIKILRPQRTGAKVVDVYFKGFIVSQETKELNEKIYEATNGKWFRTT